MQKDKTSEKNKKNKKNGKGKSKNITVLKDTTPKVMKELRHMVKKMGKKKYPNNRNH